MHKYTKKIYNLNGFDKDGLHKDTKKICNLNAFHKDGLNKDTGNKYDPTGFDRYGINKDTGNKYNPNGFDRYGIHKDTDNKYDPNGFDIENCNANGLDKDGHDMYGNIKKSSKIKTSKAKSFKYQKGKGYVDLPILLSKLNINSSKELISNIEQLA